MSPGEGQSGERAEDLIEQKTVDLGFGGWREGRWGWKSGHSASAWRRSDQRICTLWAYQWGHVPGKAVDFCVAPGAGTELAAEVEEGNATIRAGQGRTSLGGREFPIVKGMSARPERSSDLFIGRLPIPRDRLGNSRVLPPWSL